MSLNAYTHPPQSGAKPKQIIVLLHGYGSNGRDLISLAPYWQDAVPDAIFVSPDAPFPCELSPASGFQWFSFLDRTPETLLKEVQKVAPLLNKFLDSQLKKYDLDDSKLALVGFSQGTMTSLYVAPRRQHKMAGVLGYSGALIGGEALGEEGIHKLPMRLIHGEADSVVPVTAYHEARRVLEEKGFEVSGHTTAYLDHSIDGEGIESGAAFLGTLFK